MPVDGSSQCEWWEARKDLRGVGGSWGDGGGRQSARGSAHARHCATERALPLAARRRSELRNKSTLGSERYAENFRPVGPRLRDGET